MIWLLDLVTDGFPIMTLGSWIPPMVSNENQTADDLTFWDGHDGCPSIARNAKILNFVRGE